MKLGRIKPGWYVLLFALLYGLVTTVALNRSNRTLRALQMQAEAEPEVPEPPPSLAPEGLWFPIPGATLPQDEAYLPGAPRIYRRGVNQGFDFYSGDAGIPIPYGAPVIAADNGSIMRVDSDYTELTPDAWQQLLSDVSASGASDEQLNRLRGRQLWLRTDSGLILRYAHLSSIAEGILVGQSVYRGQVIAYVGNSGTDDGVDGTRRGARLHFEVWPSEDSFFGQDLSSDELRQAAAALFVGP